MVLTGMNIYQGCHSLAIQGESYASNEEISRLAQQDDSSSVCSKRFPSETSRQEDAFSYLHSIDLEDVQGENELLEDQERVRLIASKRPKTSAENQVPGAQRSCHHSSVSCQNEDPIDRL